MNGPERSPRRVEIQFHPANPKRPLVRWELGPVGVLTAKLLAVVWAVLLVVSAALAPSVARNLGSTSGYREAIAERAALGGRLQESVAQLEAVARATEEARRQLSKVALAYGVGPGAAPVGQGGYPTPERPVLQSIYAGVARHGGELEARAADDLGALGVLLEEIVAFEAAHRDQVRTTPSRSPLGGAESVLVSGYGPRRNPFTRELDFHTGADLSAPIGTPVAAPADGVVVFAGRFPLNQSVVWWRLGNLVVLRHGDRFLSLYGHLDVVDVRVGQTLRQGERLGTVGNSGWSTNPHLHYEIRRREGDGPYAPVDPRIYVLDQEWPGTQREAAGTVPPRYEPLPSSLLGRRPARS
jgi:murein DD-endopeptidase MepM/ murein hydrolase activator NlpD